MDYYDIVPFYAHSTILIRTSRTDLRTLSIRQTLYKSIQANITSNHPSNNLCPIVGFFLASAASYFPTFQANSSYVSKSIIVTHAYFTQIRVNSPNIDAISGALYTLRIQYEYTQTQFVEGARYVTLFYLEILYRVVRLILFLHDYVIYR